MKYDDLPETCRKCVNVDVMTLFGHDSYFCERTLPIEMIKKNRGQCALFEEDERDESEI